MRIRRLLIYLWTLPTTCVGLILLPLGLVSGARCQVVAGVLEICGGAVAWILRNCTPIKGGARALTLGHVILGVDRDALETARSHERVHVRQAERWGPLFIPAYLLVSLWVRLNGRDAYHDNPFEREAREQTD
jgi:hypothetical protein